MPNRTRTRNRVPNKYAGYGFHWESTRVPILRRWGWHAEADYAEAEAAFYASRLREQGVLVND